MKKETAKNVIDSLAWMEAPLGKLAESIECADIPDEERKKLKRSISEIFKGHFEITMIIANRFPEFDPDKEGKATYENLVKKYQRDSGK
jgi:hypothetical protein